MLEGQGSEGWDPSWERGIFQPRFRSVTIHPGSAAQPRLKPRIGLSMQRVASARLGRLQHGPGWHQAVRDKAPECHQQLAGKRGDGDALNAPFAVTDPVAIPDTQSAVWLV